MNPVGRKEGLDLERERLDLASARHDVSSMRTLYLLRRRRDELLSIGEPLGVRAIHVFGSVARGEDDPDSDVDLLIELEAPLGLLGLFRIEEAFGGILGRRVEVVPVYALASEASRRLWDEAVQL